MNIGIIGTGVYAVALMHALEKNNNTIKMWTHLEEIKEEYDKTHKIKSFYECEISANVSVHTDLLEVMENSQIIYIVTTSEFFNDVVKNMKPFYKNQIICIATKGLDEVTNDFLSLTVKKELNTDKIAVISGPSFAIDMINNDIVSLTVGSKDSLSLHKISQSISSEFLVIEEVDDIIGIQLCNTFKNIVAITSGMINALGYSNSANAFLITKALNELKILIENFGGNPLTILSAAGVGDLLLTCTSIKSRNYSFGQKLVNTNIFEINLDEVTVEGYYSVLSLHSLLETKNLKSTLIYLLYEIINENLEKEKITLYLKK